MRRAMLVMGVLLIAATDARAQTQRGICRTPGCPVFTPTDALIRLIYEPELGGTDFGLAIAREATTFPVGPPFVERTVTNGRHKWNLALAYQRVGFAAVAGHPLSNVAYRVSKKLNIFTSPYPDLIFTSRAAIELTIDRAILSAEYGLSNRLDVGLIVPFVHATASGTSTVYKTVRDVTNRVLSDHVQSSSSGIGDIVLRTKVRLFSAPAFSLATVVDLRLPTGDVDQLRGVGRRQTKVTVVGAATWGPLVPHLNLGYTFGGPGVTPGEGSYLDIKPSDEVNYAVGADIVTSKRVTFAWDVIGRLLRRSAEFQLFYKNLAPGEDFSIYTLKLGSVNPWLGSIAARVAVGGSWVITATALFPLDDAGVKPGVTPVIGFGRAF